MVSFLKWFKRKQASMCYLLLPMFCPLYPTLRSLLDKPPPPYASFQLIPEPDGENLVEKETVKIAEEGRDNYGEQGLEEAKGDGTRVLWRN